MRGHATRGAAITGVSQAVKLGVQFVSVVVLSRLLTPRDFGFIAMCAPVVAFINMIQGMGLSHAVVVAKTITPRQNSALFWINVILAAILTGGLMLMSPLVADFYRTPDLAPVVVGMSVCILMSGLSAQHGALVTRAMKFTRLAMIDMAAAVAGLVVALAWAIIDPSPWALVGLTLANNAVLMIGLWLSSDWRPGRPAPFAAVADMLKFGGGLSTFNLSNFFARSLDNILIGRFVGAAPLGLYDRAYKLLLFPIQQLTSPLTRVMVPVLSRLVDEPDRYRSAYARTVNQILLVATPGTLALLILADTVIPLALGPQWTAAVPIFQWLALAGLHQAMTTTIGWLFISQQRTKEYAWWGVFNAVTCAISFIVGLPWGVQGVAASYALSDIIIRLPVIWYVIGRSGPVSVRDLASIASPAVIAGAVSAAALVVCAPYLELPPLLRFGAGVAISYGAFCVGLAISRRGRTIMVEAFGITRFMFQRVQA